MAKLFLQICKSSSPDDYTDIEITGEEEETKLAKTLIDELVGNVSGDLFSSVMCMQGCYSLQAYKGTFK